ncbi:MAG: dihydrofolate reductase [Ectothiorhodospiraceae bacterium]|nr:dihydrofolate reductase [Ectothiorhodospiraceae bacterium]
MGKLTVQMFVTLDGVVQAPGGPEEDREGGFPHGGWQFPFLDECCLGEIGKNLEGMDALLMGRKTYDIFAGYWPKAPAGNRFARKMNEVPKYVASRTLDQVDWNNARRIEGDLTKAVERIKVDHGDVYVIGSADLVQSLMHRGLVDRFVLVIYPIVLGSGKRLFPEGVDPARLKLVESRAGESGAVLMTYESDGKPTYGTM